MRQNLLDVPGSELVLPPAAGLSVHSRYWPQPRAAILSVSDAETEAAENPRHLRRRPLMPPWLQGSILLQMTPLPIYRVSDQTAASG